MDNKGVKVIIAIVFIAIIGAGLYMIMPQSGKDFITYRIQMMKAEDKAIIEGVQNTEPKGYDGITFKMLLEDECMNSCWVYAPVGEDGGYTVTYTGNKASFKIDEPPIEIIETEAKVKVVFTVLANGSYSYDIYLNDNKITDKDEKAAIIKYMWQEYVSDH